MRAGYLWLAALLLLPVAGAPLLMRPAYSRFSRTCRLVLSGAAGAVAVSWIMTICATVGWRWNAPLVVTGALGLSVCLALLTGQGPTSVSERPRKEVSWERRISFGIVGLSLLVALAATAAGSASSADLLLFWGPKAERFALARTIEAEFLGGPDLAYLHTSYPPLVTNLYAFSTLLAGRFAWGAATLTFPALLTLLALALPGLLREAAPRAGAASTCALIVTTIGFLGAELEIAGNGDMPLLFFEILAMAILIGPGALERGGQLLAGLLLAGAASAKVEGLPFAGSCILLFLVLRRRELPVVTSGLRLILPTVLSLGAWFLFGSVRHLFLSYEGYGPTLQIHWNRMTSVLSEIGNVLWSAGFGIPLLVALGAWLVSPGRSRDALLPFGVAAGLCVFFVFTYLHGDPDPKLWISWSAGRIFMPVASLVALAITTGAPRFARSG